MRYRIVYEKAPRNFGAYSPDLPGCVAVGDTLEETRRLMYEAIDFHLEGMAMDGERMPKPTEFLETIRASWVMPRGSRRSPRKARAKVYRAARAKRPA